MTSLGGIPSSPWMWSVWNLFIYCTVLVTIAVSSKVIEARSNWCVVKGHLFTQLPWYGYLVQKTFHTDTAKVQYQLSYPMSQCCVNMLIYYDDQMQQLRPEMTCSERESILPARNNQIIPLTRNAESKGCTVRNTSDGEIIVCVGERSFQSNDPRTWYFGISRCGGGSEPLSMWYYFNITGYYGDCEVDPLSRTYIPPKMEATESYEYVALSLGIVSGVFLVAACAFFVLWCRSRREASGNEAQRKENESASVVSSQGTVAQDIFYTNHSLCGRETSNNTSDYSRSGSENYYEVIPERRNHESAGTNQLTVPANAHPRCNRSTNNRQNQRPNPPPRTITDPNMSTSGSVSNRTNTRPSVREQLNPGGNQQQLQHTRQSPNSRSNNYVHQDPYLPPTRTVHLAQQQQKQQLAQHQQNQRPLSPRGIPNNQTGGNTGQMNGLPPISQRHPLHSNHITHPHQQHHLINPHQPYPPRLPNSELHHGHALQQHQQSLGHQPNPDPGHPSLQNSRICPHPQLDDYRAFASSESPLLEESVPPPPYPVQFLSSATLQVPRPVLPQARYAEGTLGTHVDGNKFIQLDYHPGVEILT